MDKKPESMSDKEYLYHRVSMGLSVPHTTVKKVLDNQFRTMLSVTSDPEINSIEIAGFGKFIVNSRRIQKAIKQTLFKINYYEKRITDESLTERERVLAQIYFDELPTRLKELRVREKAYNKKKKK